MIDTLEYQGLWMMEPSRFSQIAASSRRILIKEQAELFQAAAAVRGPKSRQLFYMEEGGLAVIDVAGSMMKGQSCMGGCSTVMIRQAIRQANGDNRVKAIVVGFDTPGGTVAGTGDLAGEIKASAKPVVGYIEDCCCSAGFWAASQCRELYANNPIAVIGSIGTYMALYDVSKAMENNGVRAIVIRAGEHKAAGFPGTKITDQQISQWQKQIDAIQEQFTQGVASGRKMGASRVRRMATGAVFMAREATQNGLIDGIKSWDQFLTDVANKYAKAA